MEENLYGIFFEDSGRGYLTAAFETYDEAEEFISEETEKARANDLGEPQYWTEGI